MLSIIILPTIILAIYSALILVLANGIKKSSMPLKVSPIPGGNGPLITLLIPFRNEEAGLRDLLPDIQAQDLGKEHFQVLLVNDHSTDDSVKVVEDICKSHNYFHILHLPEDRTGKKAALALALSRAETSWVLQVDADCRVGPGFISSHLDYALASGADLVAGSVGTRVNRGGFREAFEGLDMLSLSGAGAGSFHYGRPLMCSGANLLYRKELYHDTRSFDPSGTASGDDMFLLIGARRLGLKLVFNPDPAAHVQTRPQANWRALMRQRMRWGAKSDRYRMTDIQLTALLVALANLSFVLTPLIVLFQPWTFYIMLAAAGLKILADYFLINRMAGVTRKRDSLRWYPLIALLHPLYTVIILMGMPFRGGGWR